MPAAIRELVTLEERNYGFNLEQRQEHMRQFLQSNDRDLAALQAGRLSQEQGRNEEARNYAALLSVLSELQSCVDRCETRTT